MLGTEIQPSTHTSEVMNLRKSTSVKLHQTNIISNFILNTDIYIYIKKERKIKRGSEFERKQGDAI